MSGQQIGTVLGGVVGSFFGMPQLGMMLGGMIGGAIDPETIRAPGIGDAQRQTTQAGVPRPVVYGHPAPFMGNIIDGEAKARKIITSEGGKGGGPEVEQERFILTSAIRICEGPIAGVVRVWRNGEVVYDVRDESEFPDFEGASAGDILRYIGEIRAKSAAFNGRFYLGTEDQLPDPALEAIHGVGNTPYYRGTAYMVVEDDDVTATRGAAAQWQFEVVAAGTPTGVTQILPNYPDPGEGLLTGSTSESIDVFTGTVAFYTDELPLFAQLRMMAWSPYTQEMAYAPSEGALPVNGHGPSRIVVSTEGGVVLGDSGWMGYPVQQADLNAMLQEMGMAPARIQSEPTQEAAVLKEIVVPAGTTALQYTVYMTTFKAPSAAQVTAGALVQVHYPERSTLPADYTMTPELPGALLGADGILYYFEWATAVNLDSITASALTLDNVVSDIAARCEVPATKIDATALVADIIPGFLIAQQFTGADCIRPTQQMFFFDLPEVDGQIRSVKRGAAAVAAISDADLLDASDGDEDVRAQQIEYPLKVSVVTRDPAADYAPLPQTSVRTSANVIARGETVIESPIPFGADDAMRRAEIIHKVLWAQAEGRSQYQLPEEWTRLVPADPIERGGKRWMIERTDYADGAVRVQAVYDRASNYASTATGAKPIPPVLPESGLRGATILAVMNLPPLREQDNVPGVYLAVTGERTAWDGCTVQMSMDGGATYRTVAAMARRSVMGRLVSQAGPVTEPLVVDLDYGELSDTTPGELDNGANAFALVPEMGQSEVGQFAAVTENASGAQELTGTRRGVRGTTAASHAAGEQFVMLGNALFLPLDSSLYGATLHFRAVTSGTDPATATVVPFLFEQPPVSLDIRITETGDTRITEAGDRRILE